MKLHSVEFLKEFLEETLEELLQEFVAKFRLIGLSEKKIGKNF